MSSLQQQQDALAAYIRDPDSVAPPPGIEPRRLKIYRELFFNNVSGLLAGNFPVLRSIYGDAGWQTLIRDFYRDHECRTPLFPELPREFLRYLEARLIEPYGQRGGIGDPPGCTNSPITNGWNWRCRSVKPPAMTFLTIPTATCWRAARSSPPGMAAGLRLAGEPDRPRLPARNAAIAAHAVAASAREQRQGEFPCTESADLPPAATPRPRTGAVRPPAAAGTCWRGICPGYRRLPARGPVDAGAASGRRHGTGDTHVIPASGTATAVSAASFDRLAA